MSETLQLLILEDDLYDAELTISTPGVKGFLPRL